MDNDKTKVIMGLIVASLREGLGMSRYALAQEAGVDYSWLRRFEQGKSGIRGETLIGLAKGLGIPAGTLSARWRKRWKIPIRGLRSTSGKGSEGAWRAALEIRWQRRFLGGYNEKREPTFVGSLGVILFYVLVGMKGFEPSTP